MTSSPQNPLSREGLVAIIILAAAAQLSFLEFTEEPKKPFKRPVKITGRSKPVRNSPPVQRLRSKGVL